MKAKISFTVNVTDITSEVEKLLNPALDSLAKLSKENMTINDNTLVECIRKIDGIRTSLLEVDTRLQDCYDILVGYNTALSDSFMPKEEGSTVIHEEENHAEPPEPLSD